MFEYLHLHAQELFLPNTHLLNQKKLFEPDAAVFLISPTLFSPPLKLLLADRYVETPNAPTRTQVVFMLSMSTPDKMEEQVIYDVLQKFTALNVPVTANV
jgi:hypothetical protein